MSIKNVKPSRNRKYSQGYYKPVNPDKYVGDLSKIIYRSSWEYRFMRYCDLTPAVQKWSSEPRAIKYYSPIDQKMHDYYVDFYLRVDKHGKMQDFLAEVKPNKALSKPILENRATMKRLQEYNEQLRTWIINKAKFEAAKAFADSIGYKFVLVTEEFLFENNK
jgi:hypothetical protein